MKKKGFSFLEVIIVIMIIGILFIAFRPSFQIKNKDVFYAQACIESIYGQINNFLHAAISSKSVNSGGMRIFPATYTIEFDSDHQQIGLSYDATLYKNISLSGETDIQYCDLSDTHIMMTGDTYEVIIIKGLQQNANMQSFFLSGIVGPTGGNTFRGCDAQGIGCKELARFITDTRTITLQKQMCLTFTGAGECIEWDN